MVCFAIQYLLDGCEQGLKYEGLKKRLDDFPRELEAIYQRILDGMPHKRQKETALILYLITRPGITFDYIYLNSDHLYGVWLFTLRKKDLGFASVSLRSQVEFGSYLLAMFNGLLDITEHGAPFRDKEYKRVSLIHKTVQSFLDASHWIWQNLPQAFRHKFPDSPWLRIYASAIEEAAAELDVSRDDIFEFLRRWKLNMDFEDAIKALWSADRWDGWPAVLSSALTNLLPLARGEEEKGHLVSDIISTAMCTDLLMLLHGSELTRSCFRCEVWHTEIYSLQSVCVANLGLMCGISHELYGYVRDQIQKSPVPSSEEITVLLDLIIFEAHRVKTPLSYEVTRLVFRHCGSGLQSRHLRIMLTKCELNTRDSENLEAMVILCRDLVRNRRPGP